MRVHQSGRWLLCFWIMGNSTFLGCLMGEYERREKRKWTRVATINPLCSVSGVGSTILAKSGLKRWDMWLGFVTKQKFWSFWVIMGFGLWVMGFEFEFWVMSYKYWVMKTKLCLNQTGLSYFFFFFHKTYLKIFVRFSLISIRVKIILRRVFSFLLCGGWAKQNIIIIMLYFLYAKILSKNEKNYIYSIFINAFKWRK